jgi:hypothetical protein
MLKENINIEMVLDDLEDSINEYPHFINYQLNYNIKQLIYICDYYCIKIKKLGIKKEDIIHQIIFFEADPNNYEIVSKRLNMWFYMEELKKDTFMKKFVLF